MNISELTLAKVSVDTVPLRGGFDQMTPTLDLNPGAARELVNYECALDGGYRRVEGYERYSGKTSPSSVTFKILPIQSFLSTPSVGATVTGGTSGATGVVIAIGSNYIIVTRVLIATFIHGEMLTYSGNALGVVGSYAVALTKRQRKQYKKAASDVYRALIAAVPGIGPVRGVFGATFNGAWAVYAFRDKALGGGLVISALFKAAPSGWVPIESSAGSYMQGMEVEFSNGSGSVPTEGDIWNYFGSTYKLHRVLLTGGTWSGANASGRLIFVHGGSNPGNQGAFHQLFNPQTYNGTTISTRNSLNANYLQPGGFYEFAYGNFGGQLASTRVFGCDGVNRCFEFDGVICVPITTGIEQLGWNLNRTIVTIDKPTHIAVHQNHLIVSIGSSMFNSAIGNPYNWESGNGAGEITVGDKVTGFVQLPGSQQTGALGVYARNATKILYGTSTGGTEPFELITFGGDFGALPRTILQMEDVYVLDDRGLTRLKAAQEFGNFVSATLTRKIQRYINGRTGRAVFAILNRTKGQYRLYFNDRTGLHITLANGKLVGIGRTSYADTFTCGWSGEDISGTERSFAGDSEGYVHELDKGTSHDGDAIEASILLNWNTFKSPRVRKTLRSAVFDVHDTDYAELRIGARLGPDLSDHLQDVPSDPITVTTDALSVEDSFDRDDATTLGSAWLSPFSQPISVAGNLAVLPSGPTPGHQVYGTALSSADQWAEVTLTQIGALVEQAALTVREHGVNHTQYQLVWSGLSGGSWIAKYVAGVFQYNIGTYSGSVVSGDRMRLECRTVSGVAAFRVYLNGTLIYTAEDATAPILTGSYVGLAAYSLTGLDTHFNDFRAGTFIDTVVDRAVSYTPSELMPQWDHFTWDDFYWDAHSEAPLEFDATGTADRVQWAIRSDSDYLDSHTLTSIATHYVNRRTLR